MTFRPDWQDIDITLTCSQIKKLMGELAHPVYLYSGSDLSRGHYDIFSAQPKCIIRSERTNRTSSSALLKSLKAARKEFRQNCPNEYKTHPFTTGWIGFRAYDDGAHELIDSPYTCDQSHLPLFFAAYYDWSYIFDRKKQQGRIIFSATCTAECRNKVLALIDAAQTEDATEDNVQSTKLNWSKTITKAQYLKRFARAIEYIRAGDCYQVNLAQRFECEFNGDSQALFLEIAAQLNTPYSAYLGIDSKAEILSFSPEQFLKVQQQKVSTKPIKGTQRNTGNTSEHSLLSSSLKNQAENLMIVDLLRNDLSKFCELKSIAVPKLFQIETYRNVHHLVSTVTGNLREDIGALEAFFSAFPGGSITGAPKKRAMEIINELEQSGRDAYCGSVFYLSDNDFFDSNILIRTIVRSDKQLKCWGGGGIVADSTENEEYEESIMKVANLMGSLKDTDA